MVVYCEMTPVAVTAVEVVCMEEQTALVSRPCGLGEAMESTMSSISCSLYVYQWRHLQWILMCVSTWVHWSVV